MISRQGLARLIAIHCGKYDYACVDTDSSLHLVGPNNVGKTSLIALLQFLYIDDQRKMHFSRSLEQTRRYYFPDAYSYVIFECMTPTGIQCLGVRGLGPLKMHDYERFAWTGKFEEEDFIDGDRRPLPFQKIKEKLSLKGYAGLEPKQLRAALTGIGDNNGVNLGLVPLRHRDYYERFRSAFCNLLRLSHLKQEELKELLLEIYDTEFQVRAIDLERGYTSQYAAIKRGTQEVRTLKNLVPDITKFLAHADERGRLRGRLPALWAAIGAAYEKNKNRLEREAADIVARQRALEGEQAGVRSAIEEGLERQIKAASALSRVNDALAEVEQGRLRFADFVEDWKRERRRALGTEIENLAFQLRNAGEEPAGRVKARLDRAELNLGKARERLKNSAGNAASRLKEKFGAGKSETVFKILNPELLGLPVSKDGITVKDEAAALKELTRLHEKLEGGRFNAAGLSVNLAALHGADFASFTNPEALKAEIEILERQLAKDGEILKNIERTAELKKLKAQKQEEAAAIDRELLEFETFSLKAAQAPQWRQQAAGLEKEAAQIRSEQNRLETERERLRAEADALGRRGEEADRQRRNLLKQRQGLPALPESWPAAPPAAAQPVPEDFEELLALYRDGFAREEREDAQAQDYLARIEAATYSAFKAATEEETITKLRQQLEALPEKEKLAQEAWTSLAVSLKNAFKGLKRDLDTLKTKVSDLNRKLAEVDISNLDQVRLNAETRRDWDDRLKALIDADETPLFADMTGADKALEELGALLGKYPQIKLQDLFDLHFEITRPGGETRRYPDLDRIESNGTTITIKVLINLLLLRGLLDSDKVVLPFYLDEASSLDRANLLAIMKTAGSLNFVPVLASPDALDAAEYVYFVREENGRVSLDGNSRVRCHRTAEKAAP
ncbi:MAG: hypothetical protein COT18_07080 [Elusimicrobia bacterium CG08_land_8_20_14_0_20_59_10]|nr:MAG: hypothetical protein COT18_07080 [Elusimicrobia bacterium CG08_land_8_20_14_0_20_59_10]